MTRDMQTLELPKILQLLSKQACTADAAQAALALQPADDAAEVQHLLDQTDAAYRLMAQFGSPSFGQSESVVSPLRRAQAGGLLSLRELLNVAAVLQTLRGIKDWRKRCEGVQTVLDDRFEVITPNTFLENAITTAVLSEEEISDNASPALKEIRRKMRAANTRARDTLDKLIRSPAYQKALQEPIVTIRNGRFVVPVKMEHRAAVPGLVHDTSASGATVFIEPMGAVEANNELRTLLAREQAEIERIIAELSAQAGSFADSLISDYHILVELDLIFAKARLAYAMRATLPALAHDGHLVLKRARHPLLDMAKAVPISLELGGEYDTLVITGPNTGGKTVTLKTVGLLSLMTACGLFPPADDGCRIPVYKRVLADIGDEQSIEQSLSTFSAHITNLVRILQCADERSLVLTDELGAGTDPIEGAALATAVIEQLRSQGAHIVATTHYAELKAFAIRTAGVENGSCEFDVATLRPTYRLLIGAPGRSNAFAISEKLGVSPAVVDRARSLVDAEARHMEDVVSDLEARRIELERQLTATEDDRLVARRLREEWETKQQKLQQQTDKKLEQASQQAARIIERARLDAEALMQEIDKVRRQARSADFARQAGDAKSKLRAQIGQMEKHADPVRKTELPAYSLPRALQVGDTVLIVDLGQTASVLSPVDHDGMVQVQAGVIRTRIEQSRLQLQPEKAKKQSGKVTRTAESRSTRTARSEIDLRGMAADEGIIEADRFIDEAVMAGLSEIVLIHGKGTGTLRAAIQQHLRRHPSVSNFRPGTYGEGEMGVTVVTLK